MPSRRSTTRSAPTTPDRPAAPASARGKPDLEATIERFRLVNEVLEWHAPGEQVATVTALEEVAEQA